MKNFLCPIVYVTSKNVIPAKAGIHKFLTILNSRWSLPRTCYGAGVTNLELLEVPFKIPLSMI
jgi:hypothetical protein